MNNEKRTTTRLVKSFSIEGMKFELYLHDNREFIIKTAGGKKRRTLTEMRRNVFHDDDVNDPSDEELVTKSKLEFAEKHFSALLKATSALVSCVNQRNLTEFCFSIVKDGSIEVYQKYAQKLWIDHFENEFDLEEKDGSFIFARRTEE